MPKSYRLLWSVMGLAAVWGLGGSLRAGEPRAQLTFLELAKDPLLERSIYRMDVQSVRRGRVSPRTGRWA